MKAEKERERLAAAKKLEVWFKEEQKALDASAREVRLVKEWANEVKAQRNAAVAAALASLGLTVFLQSGHV